MKNKSLVTMKLLFYLQSLLEKKLKNQLKLQETKL